MVNNKNAELLKNIIKKPLDELIAESDLIRKKYYGDHLEICGIINAKSGACSEDCQFCAQSIHYNTEITKYALVSSDEIINKAIRAKELGANKFGIVTSGNTLTKTDVSYLCDTIKILVDEIGINVCGSFGALDMSSLKALRDSGMTRYHHNIETSREYYPQIVTTHKFDERLNTIRKAKEIGLEVCSGGILGLGETWTDRMNMAITLKELDVDAVPLNFLIPIEGTPMASQKKLSEEEALRIIILFRMILMNKSIKIIAGRESVLSSNQHMLFASGANGLLVDGYLTVPGRSTQADVNLLKEIKALWKTS